MIVFFSSLTEFLLLSKMKCCTSSAPSGTHSSTKNAFSLLLLQSLLGPASRLRTLPSTITFKHVYRDKISTQHLRIQLQLLGGVKVMCHFILKTTNRSRLIISQLNSSALLQCFRAHSNLEYHSNVCLRILLLQSNA